MSFRPTPFEKDAVRASRETYAKDVAPLLESLSSLGIEISKMSTLYNASAPDYRVASQLLADTLLRTSNLVLKREIVRALGEKWAKEHAPQLIDEFIEASKYPSYQWVVGSTLEILATNQIANHLIAIAREQRYGKSREMVAWGLRKLKCEASAQALIELLDDPDVSGHALGALERRKVPIPRETLDSFIADDRPWVRKHAKRLLAVLEGSS